MIRIYCDRCEAEVPNGALAGLKVTVEGRGTWKGKRLDLEVTATTPAPDRGHFCRHCVLDALASLDDRPRPG